MAQRIVKRVSPDFQWPIGEVWHGYINPWPGPVPCPSCLTCGLNPATKKLSNTFCSWAPKLTIWEADQLFEKGVTRQEIQRLKRRTRGSDTPVIRQLLVEIRAKRKNIWGTCGRCQGDGFIANPNPAVSSLYAGVNLFQEWEPTEPPFGSGWQLWDDIEGYPVSPLFTTPEALTRWCSARYKEPSFREWEKWVKSFKDLTPPVSRNPFRIQSDHFKVYVPTKTKYVM